VGAAALVVFTISGSTARLLAQRRPRCPIHAFSPDPLTCRRLAMVWGVEARPIAMEQSVARLAAKAADDLRHRRVVSKGDVIVLVAGETPAAGATNVLKVIKV
jgi:pyruvate kinase